MPDATSLRHFVYDRITQNGCPPLLSDIARKFKTTVVAAAGALGSLNIGKTVLPHPKSGEIWMAGPFSADPTPYKVRCQVWRLALAWYTDPRAANWRPRTVAESQAVLESAGLTGDFWRLS